MVNPIFVVAGFMSILAVAGFVLILMSIYGPKEPKKLDVIELSVEEFILRLLSENRQLRELLRMREKEWENEL